MQAEVISIGDELTSGQRLDTNSQWLSERLGELGVRVLYHSTVADDLDANVRVFQTAAERADVIVATGGLGPTADDLTRDAIAAMAGRPLVLNQEVLEYIRALFARFGRDMPEKNQVQALFPEGSRVIPNPNGTAPGIDMDIARTGRGPSRIFALPGVPAEMMEMWRATVEPAIAALVGASRVIRHRRIKCFGVGESHLEQMLPDIIRRGRDPSVGITVSGAVITLRITAAGASPDDCLAAMAPTIATIHECLGDIVYGEEEDELEHAVHRLLAEKQLTLASAEWGTGGLIAQELSSLDQPQQRFLGGVVVTSAAAIESALGVPPHLLEQHGATSGAAASAMAEAARVKFGADLAIAVGELPVQKVEDARSQRAHFALATPHGVLVRSAPHAGHPSILQQRAARQALNLVRLALLRDLAID